MSTTSKTLQTPTRLYIAAITIELKKPPKHPIYAEIFIDTERVCKLPPVETNLPLRWSGVDLPIDVGPETQVALQIKESHRFRVWLKDLGSCKLSDHPDWLRSDSIGAQKEIVHQRESFTITVKFSLPSGIEGAQLLAEKAIKLTKDGPSSILGNLGQARSAVETIMAIVERVEEVHPIAKVALGVLTQAFKHLEEEEKYDDSLRDLAQGMANMLSFAKTVNQDVKIVQLKETITQMMHMVEDASRFILEDQPSSLLGRAAESSVSSTRRRKIDEFIRQFNSLRENFDRGVTVQVYQAVMTIEERSLLDNLPLAHSAGYDPSRSCMEGTRTQILQDIINWTNNSNDSTKFLWINGTPGAGKSSIASTVAKELEKMKRLGATFFCSRDKPELRDPALILPTIASRLAIIFPAFGKAVADQLRIDPHIGRSAIQFQYEGLFAEPVKQVGTSDIAARCAAPLVVVIDALDECSREMRPILLKYLLEISALTDWLKIIATSRPESDITNILCGSPLQTSLALPLDDTTVHNDIFFFTQTRMAEISRSIDNQPSKWPGGFRTKRLAEMAGGLFIWAETACKFIANGFIPENRLNQLLSKKSTPDVYSKLDALYTDALAGAFQESGSDNLEAFRLVVGTIITVLTPLPIQGIFALLRGQIPEMAIHRVVNAFRSVLYEDIENDSAIRVCHLSFRDFITDPSRCPKFCIDLPQHHTELAIMSLLNMQDQLKFNICDLKTSDIFNDKIDDLDKRVKNVITVPLRYSCVYWMSHVRHASKDVPLVEALERLLTQQTVLFWIEALSLLGDIPAAIHGLPLVIDWFEDPANANSLFMSDIHRFILGFKEPITRSTPHLYISALPFAPTESLISKRFLTLLPNIISLPDREPFWSPCVQTLEGHTGEVISVSWSPDGQRLVSGSLDCSICVWDSTTGAMIQRLRGHSMPVSCVSFSPNNLHIASSSGEATIQIWNVETWVSQSFHGHTDGVYCVIFSPDGKHLASCSADETIRIWDATTGKSVLDPLRGHSDLVRVLAYSPDGARIVSGSSDETVLVWDVKTGRTVLGPLTAHGPLFTVAFSPDGRLILGGSPGGSLIVWDSTGGGILLGPIQGGVTFANFSPDGSLILSTTIDSHIRIWDVGSGIELYNHEHSSLISSACFSPNGRHFLTGSSDRTVQIWELNSLRPASLSVTEPGHTGSVHSVGISPDGKYIASGSQDKTIRIWHAATGTPACAPLQGHTNGVRAVTFSPDSQHILSASSDMSLRLWIVGTWENTIQPFSGHTSTIICAAFSTSGHFIVSGSRDSTIRLWNPATGEEICEPLREHQTPILSLAISSDGRLIGSGSQDGAVKIWDAATRQKLCNLSPPSRDGNIWSLAFSLDGKNIVSNSEGAYVRLWDVQKGVIVWEKSFASSGGLGRAIFSRNDQHIFCGFSTYVFILDAKTGSIIHTQFNGHTSAILSIATSPNGKHLISSSLDKSIRVWDVDFQDETREELLPDAQKLFEPVGDDGWVRLQSGDPLLWIPTEYRDGLWKRALFSIPTTARNHPRTLDCSRFRHGNAWTEVWGV